MSDVVTRGRVATVSKPDFHSGNPGSTPGGPATTCQRCGALGAEERRQNTAYTDDRMNFATYCPVCQHEADDYWRTMWEEYYAGLY